MGYVAHLAFHEMAYGEHEFGNLLRVELREEIGLVFDGVLGGGKERGAVYVVDSGVMAGGGTVVEMAATLFESPEFDEFVAHDVGVGGEAAAHGIDGIGYHIVPVLLVEVDLLETASIFAGDVGGDFDILLGRTVDIAFLVFHAYADIENVGRVALFLEQVYRHGAVDSSRNQCSNIHH